MRCSNSIDKFAAEVGLNVFKIRNIFTSEENLCGTRGSSDRNEGLVGVY